jgi:hypothetical protein
MYADRTFVLRAGLAVAKTPGPSLQPALLLDAAVSTQRHDVLAGTMPLCLFIMCGWRLPTLLYQVGVVGSLEARKETVT